MELYAGTTSHRSTYVRRKCGVRVWLLQNVIEKSYFPIQWMTFITDAEKQSGRFTTVTVLLNCRTDE